MYIDASNPLGARAVKPLEATNFLGSTNVVRLSLRQSASRSKVFDFNSLVKPPLAMKQANSSMGARLK